MIGVEQAGVAEAARSRATAGPDAYRQKSVEIMSTLNPERVVRIKIPVDKLIASWHAEGEGADAP